MARGNYGPEIKGAINSAPKGKPRRGPETPADKARDVGKGIKEGSAQDMKLDALPGNRASPAQGGNAPPDLHHVAAATSIAHAILGRAGGGGGGGMI